MVSHARAQKAKIVTRRFLATTDHSSVFPNGEGRKSQQKQHGPAVLASLAQGVEVSDARSQQAEACHTGTSAFAVANTSELTYVSSQGIYLPRAKQSSTEKVGGLFQGSAWL